MDPLLIRAEVRVIKDNNLHRLFWREVLVPLMGDVFQGSAGAPLPVDMRNDSCNLPHANDGRVAPGLHFIAGERNDGCVAPGLLGRLAVAKW